jgi:predicted transcriptional regulator
VALIRQPLCVRDLAMLVGISESGVSHQLRFLRERRLVQPRREGNIVYYAVDDHHVAALFKEADYHIDHVRQGLPDHPYPALDSLARLLPDRVTVRRDREDLVLALEDVQSGDLVLIRSGDRIPVDGTVSLGNASVNQAAITGESLPVDKQMGDLVYAGTLNEVGALEVRATRVGIETTLGQIRRMVEEAQQQKAPIERILNRYATFIRLPHFSWVRWSGGSAGISCAPLPS